MFCLPTWISNLNPPIELISSTSSSNEETLNNSSTSLSSPVLPPESAFNSYSETASTITDSSSSAAAATVSAPTMASSMPTFLPLHPSLIPPPTSLFESLSPIQKSLWQKLLTNDSVASAFGSHHPGSNLPTWNQNLIRHHLGTSGVTEEFKLDPSIQRVKVGPRESTGTLKAWLCQHLKNPYPSKGEKIMLAIVTRMTLTQVSTWFANARRRLKKERNIRWRVEDDDDDDDDEYNDDGYNDDERRRHHFVDEEEKLKKSNHTRRAQRRMPNTRTSDCPSSKRRRCEEDRWNTEDVEIIEETEADLIDPMTDESIADMDYNYATCNSNSSSSLGSGFQPPLTSSVPVNHIRGTDLPTSASTPLTETTDGCQKNCIPTSSLCPFQDQTDAVDLSIPSKVRKGSAAEAGAASVPTAKTRIWSIADIAMSS